ncbi:MAG: M2 family metallopeptidase [Acidobacteria bacterium]|nr:M2 family metallopeptidase [Acidobacteriota bacterium]
MLIRTGFFLLLVIFLGCTNQERTKMAVEFKTFLADYEAQVKDLSIRHNKTYFAASVSGEPEDYQKAADLELELSKIHANTENFQKLKRIKDSGAVTEPLLARQLDVTYRAFLSKQMDDKQLEAIIELQKEIEQKFSTFRAKLDGAEKTDNELREVLQKSNDSKELERAWKASKQIGPTVAGDIVKLVKMRNTAARDLGFKNYQQMQLSLGEQDPETIEKLFDDLDTLTRDVFAEAKKEADRVLAKRYGVRESELMPWHYQNPFFQEAPRVYDVDFDKYYSNQDIEKLTKEYYAGIGLPIDDMVAGSDLYEREGKYQHAYCMDVDHEGDVRVICNIKPNVYWMDTSLHEFGHAVYDKYNSREVPWVLREPAHPFTTEAVAMLFGRFASNAAWIEAMTGISKEEAAQISEAAFRMLRLQQLVFSRWVQVMYRFEKSLYDNPEQDLNNLWWDLAEKYQMLKRPEDRNEPDWASKIHIALYPVYYHNYMMGELFASQLFYYISDNILKTDDYRKVTFIGHKEVGNYLTRKVFEPGDTMHWNEMIERATGEKLTPKYYARQFVE